MKNDVAPPIMGSFLKWHLYNTYNLKNVKEFWNYRKSTNGMIYGNGMVW